MTAHDDFDRQLTGWFEATAPGHEPEHLLGTVLARSSQTRRRPAWLIPERWTSMSAISTAAVGPRFNWRLLVLVALVLVALIVGGVLLAGGRPHRVPAPFGLAGNGDIAYITEGEVWLSAADGSGARPITSGAGIKGIPTWSRDGSRIAFLAYAIPSSTQSASLIVANADGSAPVTIVDNATMLQYFSWSPDGKSIAFSRMVDNVTGQRDRVFVAPIDGSGPPVQVGDPTLSAFNPAFSPDGRRIAFVSDHANPARADQEDAFGLHVMRADGSDVRELANAPGGDQGIGAGFENRTWGLEWSPTGDRILFARLADGETTIQVVDADSGASARTLADGAGSEYGATWSPDGTRIAFLRRDPAGRRDAIVAGADGGGERVLATDVAAFSPQWSPDGTSVAIVVSADPPAGEIHVVNLDAAKAPIVLRTVVNVSTASGDAPGADAVGWQRTAP